MDDLSAPMPRRSNDCCVVQPRLLFGVTVIMIAGWLYVIVKLLGWMVMLVGFCVAYVIGTAADMLERAVVDKPGKDI
jgi:hypothetical protein